MSIPFDAVAHGYDQHFTYTITGKALREKVWAQLEALALPANARVLELNCGTGEDALWMARKGWQVLSTDISTEMLTVAERKAISAGQSDKLKFEQRDMNDAAAWTDAPFDLIFSNFGGMNCLSPDQLRHVLPGLYALLKPGGHLVLVPMGRFCGWETLYFLAKGRFRAAFRRRSRGPVAAPLTDQTRIDTWYYAPGMLQAYLSRQNLQSRAQPLGLWLPPAYLNALMEKHPRLFRGLNRLERSCAPAWLAGWADHYVWWVHKKSEPVCL